jgi:hypothetical protein
MEQTSLLALATSSLLMFNPILQTVVVGEFIYSQEFSDILSIVGFAVFLPTLVNFYYLTKD